MARSIEEWECNCEARWHHFEGDRQIPPVWERSTPREESYTRLLDTLPATGQVSLERLDRVVGADSRR